MKKLTYAPPAERRNREAYNHGSLRAAVLMVLGVAVFFSSEGASGSSKARVSDPSPEAKEVLRKVQDYRSWQRFSKFDKPVKSVGHDHMYVVAWYNSTAQQKNKQGKLPDGSLIVKENRPKPNAAPAALTTMAKQNGGWYWLKHTPDGKVLVENGKPVAGKVQNCIGCHSLADQDMVFSDF